MSAESKQANSRIVESAAPPPHLSDEYHRARKQYALFSGLLIAWTLIGIEVAENVRLIDNLNLKLRTPDVLPLILFIMVLYFAYRTAIEWYQCDPKRRALLVSKIDFRVANLLGLLSIGTLIVDQSLDIPIGKYLASLTSPITAVCGAALVYCPLGAAIRYELQLCRIDRSPEVLLPMRHTSRGFRWTQLILLTMQPISILTLLVMSVISVVEQNFATIETIYAFAGLISILVGVTLPARIREFIMRPWLPGDLIYVRRHFLNKFPLNI